MNNNNIGIFLNTSFIGGAERSIIHQAKIIGQKYNVTFTVYIPKINNSDSSKLQSFIRDNLQKSEISFINFPSMLYKVSRSNSNLINKLSALLSLIFTVLTIKKIKILPHNIYWCNGNKISFLIFIKALFQRFDGTYLWHFRDYLHNVGVYRYLWLFVKKAPKRFKLIFISNSKSVEKNILKVMKNYKTINLYNPVGENIKKNSNKKISKIGIASMLTPWKGIHQVILWTKLYEEELIKIGIEEVSIYGSSPYLTNDGNTCYKEQVRKLVQKMDIKLISFKGNASPEVIYKSIDLLIHPSIKKEPFGRIIVESYAAQIPILTTGLGGAGEISTDTVFMPYDYQSLYFEIEKIATNEDYKNDIILKGNQKLEDINASIERSLKEIMKESKSL